MKTLLLILSIVPALIDTLKAVETAIHGTGHGEQKLALVRGIMAISYEGLSEIWPTLEKVIGKIVDVFNSLGVFEKNEEPAA